MIDTVVDPKELTVNVEISENAYIGATSLRVTTGTEFAETQINVEAQSGDPVLGLAPKEVPRGVADYPVLATAQNFDFVPSSVIECIEDGCDIDSWTRIRF